MSYKAESDKKKHLNIRPGVEAFIDNQIAEKAIHEAVEIKLFYKGSSTLLIGNDIINTQSGDVVVINPYEFHSTINYGDEKARYHLIMVPLDYFPEDSEHNINLRTLLLIKGKSFYNLFSNNQELNRILQHVVDEYEKKDEAYEFVIRGLMMEFFALLFRNGIKDKSESGISTNSFRHYTLIEPALRCIKYNYKKNITVDELAKLCNVSKYYFCHIFKSVTQKTAMEYLRKYRLELANIMLRTSDASITSIAEQCGFEDVNYFCRLYKNNYGISPGRYRESQV